MKKSIAFRILATLAFAPLAALNAQLEQGEEPGGYLFFGTDASAYNGKSNFPIVAVDRKNIFVDMGTEVKKISSRAPCTVRPELILTEDFVEVLEMRYNTTSMGNLQRAAQAVSDMHVAEFQSEVEIARIRGFGGFSSEEDLSEQDLDRIADIQQTNDDFQASMQDGLDHGAFEVDDVADTVFVKGAIMPYTDIEGAYCIVVVTFRNEDLETGEDLGFASYARARYLGDLAQGDIVDLNVRCAVNEFNKEEATYHFYLFSQDGTQVAMSNSRGLKPLTSEEVATYRDLESRTALRKDS